MFVYFSDGYCVYLTDPELIRFVTVKNAHKFARSNFITTVIPSISKGLLASSGKAHSRQKRMIGPAFSSTNLREFLYIFQENTEKLVQVIHVHWHVSVINSECPPKMNPYIKSWTQTFSTIISLPKYKLIFLIFIITSIQLTLALWTRYYRLSLFIYVYILTDTFFSPDDRILLS